MPGRHTADNLIAKLGAVVTGLVAQTRKVAACVHDNARNIVAAQPVEQFHSGLRTLNAESMSKLPERMNWDSDSCLVYG